MYTSSAQPSTIEEVQAAIENWFGIREQAAKPKRALSVKATGTGLDVLVSHRARQTLKIEMVERCLQFQVKHRRLNLNLEKFLVRSAYEGNKLCFRIERDRQMEHRLLGSVLREFNDTKHPAFCARILRAVKDLETELPSIRIEEVTAAPTDSLVMLEAVTSAPWVSELAAEDPVLASKFRGLELRREMLKTAGGVLSARAVADLLNISRQAVDKRRAANQLLALTQGRRGYSYPSFQFQEGRTLEGLGTVLTKLKSIDNWMQLKFFITPHERLGNRTPIEALQSGRINDVVSVASAYGEQGPM
jgi:hypothetical protein